MKKNILKATAIGIIMAVFILPSCEFLEDCGTCIRYEEENGVIINESTPLLFCGDELIEKQNSTPTKILGVTTYWECN